jgi:phosphodiesterase/alkaline phosphatase D-like protein
LGHATILNSLQPRFPRQGDPGRVYRKISYGPLLDIFMLDMRSYRGPNGEDKQEACTLKVFESGIM